MFEAVIYRSTRDNKRYVLEEKITCGDKVCLVPMDKKTDDKFVSPKTLKRWYTKEGEFPYVFEVEAFTGMKIGVFQAHKDQDGNFQVWTKKSLLVFDGKTHKQINAKNPKFANKLGVAYGYIL